MKICLIGKFPPIEGGVSTSTFWLARGLAQRGHQVYVVTNAMEVESEYRMHLGKEDLIGREPTFPESGGFVRVFDSEFLSGRMTHIPWHNPFVTKLASMATQVIREHGCEVIFAHYFEPYGLAAHLASIWTDVPWVVRHAGSDIDRLMRVPQLSTAYKESLRRADAVVTRGQLVERFVGMGVDIENIFSAEGFSPSSEAFHPAAEPLDVNALPKRLEPKTENGPVPFDSSKPTIGIYGKVGVFKGSYDLLRAMALLRDEGLDFNFLAMTQGRQYQQFEKAVHELELADRTWILPFQPNWQVPSFIQRCTAVCFLERDFPIKIHTPTIAIEVLTAGGCLVLSGEIAAKQRYSNEMVDGKNLFLVDDPKDHSDLASKLRIIIQSPEKAATIGRAGRELMPDPQAHERYIDSWEQIILRVAGHPSTALSFPERIQQSFEEAGGAINPEILLRHLPWTQHLLGERFDEAFQGFVGNGSRPQSPKSWVEVARAFCSYLGKLTEAGEFEDAQLSAEACLRFENERLWARADDEESRRQPPFPDVDKLCGAPVSSARALSLKPIGSSHTRVIQFPVDPTPWIFGNGNGEGPSRLDEQETWFLFHRAPNLLTTELKISPTIVHLLDLCDGSRTTEEIVAALGSGTGAGESKQKESAALGALQSLYDHRILAFCS